MYLVSMIQIEGLAAFPKYLERFVTLGQNPNHERSIPILNHELQSDREYIFISYSHVCQLWSKYNLKYVHGWRGPGQLLFQAETSLSRGHWLWPSDVAAHFLSGLKKIKIKIEKQFTCNFTCCMSYWKTNSSCVPTVGTSTFFFTFDFKMYL